MRAMIIFNIHFGLSGMMAGQLVCGQIEKQVATKVANRIVEYINRNDNKDLKAEHHYDQCIEVQNLSVEDAKRLLALCNSKDFLFLLSLTPEDCNNFKVEYIRFDMDEQEAS